MCLVLYTDLLNTFWLFSEQIETTVRIYYKCLLTHGCTRVMDIYSHEFLCVFWRYAFRSLCQMASTLLTEPSL
ncbi:mCG147280 [Mus musculus]|nr:mCG147280 [Mus musculus]